LEHLSLSHRARNSYPPAAIFTSLIFFAPSLPFLGGLHDLLISWGPGLAVPRLQLLLCSRSFPG
jgi:hypothetical protein